MADGYDPQNFSNFAGPQQSAMTREKVYSKIRIIWNFFNTQRGSTDA